MREFETMKKKFHFRFSATEIKHITLALLALAFAFSLILYREKIFVGFFSYKPIFFINSLIAVGFAFVLHELAHKFVAQRKNCIAEFRAWPAGLFIAVAMALFTRGGFVFAAPGAVMIAPFHKTKNGIRKTKLTTQDIGLIGVAGPLVNIVLAGLFGLLMFTGLEVFHISAQINAWLAIFNLIPFALLDGQKIMRWDFRVWFAMILVSVILFFTLVGASL